MSTLGELTEFKGCYIDDFERGELDAKILTVLTIAAPMLVSGGSWQIDLVL